jgi:hypothetical protein
MAAQSVESHLKKLARDGRVNEEIVHDTGASAHPTPSRWRLA